MLKNGFGLNWIKVNGVVVVCTHGSVFDESFVFRVKESVERVKLDDASMGLSLIYELYDWFFVSVVVKRP